MSWLRIDDAFEDHPKVVDLSDAAHRLWVRAACWCQQPERADGHGFVPRAWLRAICKYKLSQARAEKLAQELVDSTAGGAFAAGLWEAVEGGWRFHDWSSYQSDRETMSRTDAARAAGLRSAERRRERYGSAQPRAPERPPNDSPNVPERRSERPPNDVRPNDSPNVPERPEPPDPDPDPEISEELLPKEPDRSSAREASLVVVVAADSPLIPCPCDLALTEAQEQNLAMGKGVRPEAIEAITVDYRGAYLGKPNERRTLEQWRSGLHKAVSRDGVRVQRELAASADEVGPGSRLRTRAEIQAEIDRVNAVAFREEP